MMEKKSLSIVVVDLSTHPRNVPLGMKLAPANLGAGSHLSQKAKEEEEEEEEPSGRSAKQRSLLLARRTRTIPENQHAKEEEQHEDSGASTVTIVVSWERVSQKGNGSSSSLGPVQRAGTVRLGDRLVAINGADVTAMSFRQVMSRLKELLYDPNHMPASPKDDGDAPCAAATTHHSLAARSRRSAETLQSLSFAPLSLSMGDANPSTMSESSNSYLREPFLAAFGSSWLRWITKPTGMTGTSLVDPSDLTYSSSFSTPHDQRLYTFTSSIQRVRLGSRLKQMEEDTGTTSVNKKAPTEFTNPDQDGELPLAADKMETVVEYEIVCTLAIRYGGGVLLRIGGGPPEEHTWSVWKRYSEFKALHERLRISHGWQLDAVNDGWGVQFPPRHVALSLCQRPTNPSFVQKRRTELNRYWRSLQVVHDLFDFGNPSSHRYPTEIAAFLCVEQHLNRTSGSGANTQRRSLSCQSLEGPSRRGRLDSSSYGQDEQPAVGGGGGGLVVSADSWPSGRLDEGMGDDASSCSLSFHSGVASGSGVGGGGGGGSGGASVARRKRKIQGGAKPAFQRHVF